MYTIEAVIVTRYFVLIFAKKKIFFLSQAWWYIPVVLVCVGIGGGSGQKQDRQHRVSLGYNVSKQRNIFSPIIDR